MTRFRSVYWKIADALTFPLVLIAALGAIENSFGYGMIGAIMHGRSFAVFVTGVS